MLKHTNVWVRPEMGEVLKIERDQNCAGVTESRVLVNEVESNHQGEV